MAQVDRAMARTRALSVFIQEQQAPAGLALACEQIVNYAKMNGPYVDRTGNLRRSIAYTIVGPHEKASAPFGTVGGAVPDPVMIENDGSETWGVVYAGMRYGLYVERKPGYWVLSGAVNATMPAMREVLGDGLKLKAVPLEPA